MRVQLMKGRSRSEAGTVAVVVAAMATALFVLCGFAVDFGQAYNSKRQLQTAADSGALAAAAVLAQYPGTCPTVIGNATAVAAARQAAIDAATANRAGQSLTWNVPTCVNGNPQVNVIAGGTTTSLFGRLGGIGDNVGASRTASALTDVPPNAGGIRPLALCGAQVPAGPYGTNGAVTRIDFPGKAGTPAASCPAPSVSGNWWILDCPDDHAGSASAFIAQVTNGCASDIQPVPGQAAATSPAQLYSILTTACPNVNASNKSICLSGNPGNITQGGNNNEDAWSELIDNGTQIGVPIFCVPTTCSPAAVTGSGNDSIFPVQKIAGVMVCGWHYAHNKKYAPTSGPNLKAPCTAAAATALMNDNSSDVYFNFVFILVRESGATGGVGGCSIGTECDGGFRRVQLVQ